MQVEKELAELSPKKDMLLTVGVFDGVHLGHKHLIAQLTTNAKRQNLLSGVVTFHQHPQEILSPQTKLPFLTDLAKRMALLKNEGVDATIPLSFTDELVQLNASRFLNLLKKHLRMRGLVVGPDFALGRNREGNIDTIRSLGQDMNFSVTVIPPAMIDNEVVSSTAIRDSLADGNMKRVLKLTGRPFILNGNVISGEGRGAKLGFPTANLDIDPQQALPADGVYATWTYIDNQAYPSMTNVGRRPTFPGSERTVEVLLLDYHNNLYGRELKIDIIERLRSEKQFNTAEELKNQIAKDIKRGRAILNTPGIEVKL
ncbi:MAG: riboflavin biosynthesis protein RibF [Dehalococcoidales bacterium]|nr:riboflavin biosynthesis protein RibF [Dehalococcoidales bacterium]